MPVITIANEHEFSNVLNSSKNVVVDYYAKWCRPCLQMAPKFDQFSEKYNATFVNVNIDENVELAKEIRSLPTFRVYVNGQLSDELVGADPNKLEELIAKNAMLRV